MLFNKKYFSFFFKSKNHQENHPKLEHNVFIVKTFNWTNVTGFKYNSFFAYQERESLYAMSNIAFKLNVVKTSNIYIVFYIFVCVFPHKNAFSNTTSGADSFTFFFYQQFSLNLFYTQGKSNSQFKSLFTKIAYFFGFSKTSFIPTKRNLFYYKRRISVFSENFYPLSVYYNKMFFNGLNNKNIVKKQQKNKKKINKKKN